MERIISIFVICVCYSYVFTNDNFAAASEEPWRGHYFPFGPDKSDLNPIVNIIDDQAPISMTNVDPACDDGKNNLQVDWDGGSWAYICDIPRTEKYIFKPNPSISPVLECDHIPKAYRALHRCMNSTISYDRTIPTFGTHRPIWAKYGEYKYLPRQRWLHNLEHGAVVMLYHPCADLKEVKLLKSIVKSCLRRYVITADIFIPEDRPLVLVTWGCTYRMSYIHPSSVRSFIKGYALHGTEEKPEDGLYDNEILHSAEVVSDINDSNLCPNNQEEHM